MSEHSAPAADPGQASPAATVHADQVRALFDAKAACWPAKYGAGGRLAGRLSQLARVVGELARPGGELLDLGCGTGELARHLAARGYRVTGCDIAPTMLRQAATADVRCAVGWVRLEPGWQALPLAENSLDAVVSASVLEYVPDPGTVLAECARVLRPGGVLVCTVPDVTHPVRWLEWPLRMAASTPFPASAPRRAAEYLAYLRTSRQRRRVGWWYAAARRAGLEPVATAPAPRAPLRLLVFVLRGKP